MRPPRQAPRTAPRRGLAHTERQPQPVTVRARTKEGEKVTTAREVEGKHIAETLVAYIPEMDQWRQYALIASYDDNLTGADRVRWGQVGAYLRDAADCIDRANSAVPGGAES